MLTLKFTRLNLTFEYLCFQIWIQDWRKESAILTVAYDNILCCHCHQFYQKQLLVFYRIRLRLPTFIPDVHTALEFFTHVKLKLLKTAGPVLKTPRFYFSLDLWKRCRKHPQSLCDWVLSVSTTSGESNVNNEWRLLLNLLSLLAAAV